MTTGQVKQYIKNLKKAQTLAQAKLDLAKANGEFETEESELQEIENLLKKL
jgi:tellurite resistance protein